MTRIGPGGIKLSVTGLTGRFTGLLDSCFSSKSEVRAALPELAFQVKGDGPADPRVLRSIAFEVMRRGEADALIASLRQRHPELREAFDELAELLASQREELRLHLADFEYSPAPSPAQAPAADPFALFEPHAKGIILESTVTAMKHSAAKSIVLNLDGPQGKPPAAARPPSAHPAGPAPLGQPHGELRRPSAGGAGVPTVSEAVVGGVGKAIAGGVLVGDAGKVIAGDVEVGDVGVPQLGWTVKGVDAGADDDRPADSAPGIRLDVWAEGSPGAPKASGGRGENQRPGKGPKSKPPVHAAPPLMLPGLGSPTPRPGGGPGREHPGAGLPTVGRVGDAGLGGSGTGGAGSGSGGSSAGGSGAAAAPSLCPPLVDPQRVSLGFARPDAAERPLGQETLAAGKRYLLWVEISPKEVEGSLSHGALLQELREGDVLDVIVFPFPGQLDLEGARHGRLEIRAEGNRVAAAAWAAEHRRGEAGKDASEPAPPRLYFALRAPVEPGRHALRCNIYRRGLLLQSHVVRAQVTAEARPAAAALTALLDYNLSSALTGGQLPPGRDCNVSLFINDDGRGTHSFRFVSSKDGVPEVIGDGHLEDARLAKMIDYARRGLRWTAWGTEEPWQPGQPCKFGGKLDKEALAEALIRMARRGANLWMEVASQFSFVGRGALTLREQMRASGRVQIALKESPDSVVPVALIYDYPFDVAKKRVSLCPAALAAIEAGGELIDCPCFSGACPSYDDRSVVCPGGFWGFRHDLGLPLHLPTGDVAEHIARGPELRAFAPISTDENFTLRDQHLQALRALFGEPADRLEVLRDRDVCLQRLKEARQIVYFYCHGGVTEADTPFLRVGALDSEDIFAETLLDAGVTWDELRPLVILNGCHTTAASPDAVFSLLSGFASQCNAAGVIGTEITNFELIATTFGHELLRNFLGPDDQRRQLGRAVRLARLAVLRMGNPLGLMYIPFALPGLQLQ